MQELHRSHNPIVRRTWRHAMTGRTSVGLQTVG